MLSFHLEYSLVVFNVWSFLLELSTLAFDVRFQVELAIVIFNLSVQFAIIIFNDNCLCGFSSNPFV